MSTKRKLADVSGGIDMSTMKPCPFCGARQAKIRSRVYVDDVEGFEWTCGTREVWYRDTNERLPEPDYKTGTECDKTVFGRRFLESVELLKRVMNDTSMDNELDPPLRADITAFIKDVSGELLQRRRNKMRN